LREPLEGVPLAGMDFGRHHLDMTAGRCTRCGTASGPGDRFCMSCGAPLQRNCPGCGAPAREGATFCVSCGTQLDRPAKDVQPGPEERRTVTVLFADIVGYTSISERLDHESVKALTDRCLKRLSLEVERYGGYVDQYLGDSIMAVFGAPVAHDNDAERAVRAAHAMHSAIAELGRSFGEQLGLDLSLHIGVNTGDTLAGLIGPEYTVVGDAVNVAARLQGAAPAGRTLVGDRTRRATAGVVSYRAVGALALKGKESPVSAWEVVRVEPAGQVDETGYARAPLIGRRDELTILTETFEQVAEQRSPQLVALIGEGGVGKTRLLHELEQRLRATSPGTRLLHGRALAFGSESAFGPLAQMLREQCAITESDDAATSERKLTTALGPLMSTGSEGESSGQRLAPLARLLGGEGRRAPDEADGERERDVLFAAVRALFAQLASEQVVVLVWEDAQWADEGTLALIDHLAERSESALLQVCIGREELVARRPRWAVRRTASRCLFVEPLPRDEALSLIDALIGTDGPDAGERELLARRTGGNPLFAHALVDSLAEGHGTAQVPDTVKGMLATRLDGLEPFERQLLGHASVVGLTFSQASLAPLATAGGGDLSAALAELRRRNLIRAVDASPDAHEFTFDHMLIREVAYEMLPKSVRARKHVEVAAAIEAAEGPRGKRSAFALAEHYGLAATLAAEVHLDADELRTMRRGALEHGIAAGDAAAELFSNQEALERYRAAAAFAESDDPAMFLVSERCGDAELRLGRADAAMEAWRRCLAHSQQLGEAEHAAELHRKIAAALVHSGERDEAVRHLQRGIKLVRDLPPSHTLTRLFGEAATLYAQAGANMLAAYAAERALIIAEQLGDEHAAGRALTIHGRVFGRIGDTARARESLERAVELAGEHDPEEVILALLAAGRNLDQCEGDYGGAHERYQEALRLARLTGDLPAQIELNTALAQLALYRCDWDSAERSTQCAAELAEQEGLASKMCLADVLRGRLQWRAGDLAGSVQLLSSARAAAGHLGLSEVSVQALLALAAALADRDCSEEAANALEEAIELCERAGLTPQGAEACAALTRIRMQQARAAAAGRVVDRCRAFAARAKDPVSRAAWLEAQGMVASAEEGLRKLEQAREAWADLGRPLDAVRCLAERAQLLQTDDPGRAATAAEQAEVLLAELGVTHLAACWQELSTARA
jgi:class 3 adenylate cyclase/tetratricopeptide (TPR) repeat protein